MPEARERGERLPSGVPGLDEILRGGLPSRRLYLLQGSPGAGKTTFCLQFLVEGARRKDRCLYVTLSETASEIRAVADSHGWSLDGIHMFEAMTAERERAEETSVFHVSDVDLGERMTSILAAIERVQPQRMVIDSCTELRLLAQNTLRFRREILALRADMEAHDRTILLIDNPDSGPADVLIQTLVYGDIELLRTVPAYGPSRRRLVVHKMRGLDYQSGYHDFTIEHGGIRIFPRLVPGDEPVVPLELEPLATGLADMDALLGGGIDRGQAVLVMGPTGVGKSVLVSQFVASDAERAGGGAFFTFDEAADTALRRADGLGIPLRRHVESGRVLLRQVQPAELEPGRFAAAVRAQVEEKRSRIVVIDSLNGYLLAMQDQTALAEHLHDLLAYLGRRGVVTFLVVSQHGILGELLRTEIDVSYLADAIILLRYFEVAGEIRKAVSVAKKRTGYHEGTIRELALGPGVRVGRPLVEFQGVLTGVPRYHGEEGPSGPLMSR